MLGFVKALLLFHYNNSFFKQSRVSSVFACALQLAPFVCNLLVLPEMKYLGKQDGLLREEFCASFPFHPRYMAFQLQFPLCLMKPKLNKQEG